MHYQHKHSGRNKYSLSSWGGISLQLGEVTAWPGCENTEFVSKGCGFKSLLRPLLPPLPQGFCFKMLRSFTDLKPHDQRDRFCKALLGVTQITCRIPPPLGTFESREENTCHIRRAYGYPVKRARFVSSMLFNSFLFF